MSACAENEQQCTVIGADDDVVSVRFDDASTSWLLRAGCGDQRRAGVVIDQRPLHIPNLPAHNDFRGPVFHQADWDPAFDPGGQRVAVIGARGAHVMKALSGADVTLFDCPPTWETRKTERRWLPRKPHIRLHVVASPIAEIASDAIRTADGTEYVVDAIVYATGSSIKPGVPDDAVVGSNGLTIQRAWCDAATAYLGVAVHGFPNYFLQDGPDSPVTGDQARYVEDCRNLMKRRGSARVEVRRSAQHQYIQRAHVTPPAKAFDFAQPTHHEIYDGPATLTIGGDAHTIGARLTGHLDPIDGKYHWQGTVYGAEIELPKRPVTITTDRLTTQAKITEQTPWGSYSIAGVGAPPYECT